MGLDCRLNEILPTVVEESTSFPFIKGYLYWFITIKDIVSKKYTWAWNDLFVYNYVAFCQLAITGFNNWISF